MTGITVHLCRHGKVDSHRGDVPLSADAGEAIEATARRIFLNLPGSAGVEVLASSSLRARQTGERLRDCLARLVPDVAAGPVRVEHAIRNPDIFLAGQRVEMVSTGETMAAQLPAGLMSGGQICRQPFYGAFFDAPDRVGYWLHHRDPPGEDAAAVARRVVHFFRSFGDALSARELEIVAVSHSPVMRAVLIHFLQLEDPGEPDWVEPISLRFDQRGSTISFRDITREITPLAPANLPEACRRKEKK